MKLKIKLEYERIVEVSPEDYPPDSTLEDIIRIEKESVRDDPFLVIDYVPAKVSIDVLENDI